MTKNLEADFEKYDTLFSSLNKEDDSSVTALFNALVLAQTDYLTSELKDMRNCLRHTSILTESIVYWGKVWDYVATHSAKDIIVPGGLTAFLKKRFLASPDISERLHDAISGM